METHLGSKNINCRVICLGLYSMHSHVNYSFSKHSSSGSYASILTETAGYSVEPSKMVPLWIKVKLLKSYDALPSMSVVSTIFTPALFVGIDKPGNRLLEISSV